MSECIVSSEVHTFTIDQINISDNTNTYFSRFTFTLPKSWKGYEVTDDSPELDEDGDLVVSGRRSSLPESTLVIEHNRTTTLPLVGEQVWRGALLLADYVLHNEILFKDRTVLELGCGTGLTGIVAAHYAKRVICTDVDRGNILNLCRSNFNKNTDICEGSYSVMELDWFSDDWSEELMKEIETVDILLAADVVYSTDLTEAFFKTVKTLMIKFSPKELYVALERRYCFTIDDQDTVAPMYHDFLTNLKNLVSSDSSWKAQPIPIESIPQYFNYEKVKELVLWKITFNE